MTALAAGEEWRREQQLRSQVVEVRRVELLTSCLQSRRSNQLSYTPRCILMVRLVAKCGGLERTRTSDLTLIRRVL